MSFFAHIPDTNPNKNIVKKKKSLAASTPPTTTTNSFIKELAPTTIPKSPTNTLSRSSSVPGSPVTIRSSTPTTSNPNSPQIDPKEFSVGSNTSECDILYLDSQIKKNLSNNITSLPSLYDDLKHLQWIIDKSTDTIDRLLARENISLLRKRIQDLETGFEYGLYILRTADLIAEYKTILHTTKPTSFIRTTTNRDESKIHRRKQLILEYLSTAREYANLENYKQRVLKPTCGACHSTDLTLSAIDGESTLVCGCGTIVEQLDDAPTFKDSERVNMSSRYTYTCRGHFIEAMNRFEGKQNIEVPTNIVELLQLEVRRHNLTPDTATKDHIYMFMTESKLSDYYADINLIYFKITAKNPPDITNFRNELLEMHEQLEEAYLEVKDDERLNSLNVNWKLYKLLQLLGYDCKKDDFFCLKTPTKQGEHEQKWQSMMEYLRQKYPVAVTSFGNKRWRYIRTL